MTKTLLIVGAGAEQVPAYQLAKARGLCVVGTDINPHAPGFALADFKLHASTRDAVATLHAVRQFVASHSVHGVMTVANDVPHTVAVIAEALGLPGISVDSALLVSDKLLMKRAFQAAEVACPWFAPIEQLDQLTECVMSNPLKRFVIKPVDGRGARGVLLIDSQTDLAWAYEEARRWGDCGRVLLEEFVPGLQLSTESFLLDGVAYTPAIAERNYEFLDRFAPYIIENGGTIPALLSAQQKEEINRLIECGAAALGVREGIVKGDLIIEPDGRPVIVELALRLSGGWFASHQIPAASGVNLINAVISHALGERVTSEELLPTHHRSTAIRYWFPPSGIVKSLQGEESLRRLEGLISYGFFRKVGDHQPPVKMHPDRFGYLIVEADDRDTAMSRVDAGLARLQIGIES